ncbi:hypothetical protein HY024_04900 [Candidatus Curtissbacteria bacterium]|nr:hypothetical protein [Candidatus Curtissbacteria bacterium]
MNERNINPQGHKPERQFMGHLKLHRLRTRQPRPEPIQSPATIAIIAQHVRERMVQPEPEPGHDERFSQAVGRYFYGTPDAPIPSFHLRHLLIEHPDVFTDKNLLGRILETANAIYDKSIKQLECRQAPLPSFPQR